MFFLDRKSDILHTQFLSFPKALCSNITFVSNIYFSAVMKCVPSLKRIKDFSEFPVEKFRGQVVHVIQALCLIMIAGDAVMLSALINPRACALKLTTRTNWRVW
jgi:hypothetical protein